MITKGSDTGISLSALVNQNHSSRVVLESKLQLCSPLELSDGDILIKASMSVVNNASQHVLSAGLVHPAWNAEETF